jgi:hypothetical protein
MRLKVTVTDDHGQTFEGELDLTPAVRRSAMPRQRQAPVPVTGAKVDFGLPRRAFLKQHAKGSGPRKFAVLVAHMTQGKTDVQVTHDAVVREWTRNKGVLGGDFQNPYATRSKGEGWTDSPKRGTFVLRSDWRGALKQSG